MRAMFFSPARRPARALSAAAIGLRYISSILVVVQSRANVVLSATQCSIVAPN